MDTNKLIQVYIKIRDARSELKQKYEAEDSKLQDDLKKIEHRLLKLTEETGTKSLKTDAGTATRTVRTRHFVTDWAEFKNIVKEYDAFDLFEKRIAQRVYEEFAAEHPDLKMPVQSNSEYVITVRRGK